MNKKSHRLFLAGALTGVLSFFILFGIRIIDVTYVDWLHNKGDLTQHYNGWLFFRNSKWFFPYGLMDTIAYPQMISVVYTDSIPLFALLFKFLSPVLPPEFQYFGLWGLFCYGMMGGMAAVLLAEYIKDVRVILFGVLFFTFSPWMFQRIFSHSALAAHWIILICMYLCVNISSYKSSLIKWSGLFSVAAMIHLYFLPICEVFVLFFSLRRYLIRKDSLKRAIAQLLLPTAAAFIVLWITGAFYGTVDYNIGGLGEACANLNFLINPVGKSRFLKDMVIAGSKWPEEGCGYLGAGGIILVLFALYSILIKNNIVEICKKNLKIIVLVIGLNVVFLILALGPNIGLNSHVLFTVYYPGLIKYVLEIFRSTGRFVWPVCYMVLIISLITVYNTLRNKRTAVVFIICFIIQIIDLSGYYATKSEYVKSIRSYTGFSSQFSDSSLEGYVYCIVFDMENWAEVGDFAATNQLKLNDTYLARKDYERTDKIKQVILGELENGEVREDTIYIFPGNWDLSELGNICLYEINGIRIGSKDKLKDMDGYLLERKK